MLLKKAPLFISCLLYLSIPDISSGQGTSPTQAPCVCELLGDPIADTCDNTLVYIDTTSLDATTQTADIILFKGRLPQITVVTVVIGFVDGVLVPQKVRVLLDGFHEVTVFVNQTYSPSVLNPAWPGAVDDNYVEGSLVGTKVSLDSGVEILFGNSEEVFIKLLLKIPADLQQVAQVDGLCVTNEVELLVSPFSVVYEGYEYWISDYADEEDESDRYNWEQSRAACQADDGDLAMIKDQATLDWLVANVLPVEDGCDTTYFFWVGLWKPTAPVCAGCRGDWEWLDGTPLAPDVGEWADDEPSKDDRHNRLRACRGSGYVWWPTSKYNKYRYLCARLYI